MVTHLKKLINRFGRQHQPQEARVPSGVRVYAIGDIHGCAQELTDLLRRIEIDLIGWHGEAILVFLGDYVDRGPDSSGVLDILTGDLPGSHQIFLCGNHEEAMLSCLAGKSDLARWLHFGGKECLESYGLSMRELFAPGFDITRWAVKSVPEAHLEFLGGLKPSYRIGDYFFAHAGIRPGVPLNEQRDRDLRWIRAEFIDDRREHGAIIVHGHTISTDVADRSNRIGIDTGCYSSGVLTAAVLEAKSRRFIQTKDESRNRSL